MFLCGALLVCHMILIGMKIGRLNGLNKSGFFVWDVFF